MRRQAPRFFAALALVACSHTQAPPASPVAVTQPLSAPAPVAPAPPPGASAVAPPSTELVESWPLETALDHSDLRDAKDVWRGLIDGARTRLDFAEFYASDDPKAPSALTPIIEAVERAAARGVKVRWLADAQFAKTYPQLLERFAKAGVDVRRFDVAKSLGGVLHAKYFLADGQAYLGSQNFDWRSLEHIQELGVRTAVPAVVRALGDVFELDWALASGGAPPTPPPPATGALGFPIDTDVGRVTFVASPKGWLPDPRLWDLPAIVKLIDSATHTVRVQLLTYRARGGHSGDFPEIESALQRAAARGVKVELLVSDWAKRKGMVEGLQALTAPSLEVKFLTVPQHSAGFVPFARVAHAKYLVVDGARAWVGTSNWERDYFYASRNVGLVFEGGPLPGRLEAFFDDNWNGKLAETIDPTRAYAPPHVGE
jgi:phosphatidylserine/phosphatidylglycerophosphate/cardiolipin synthase-like enzyme